jgi:hypothetical protein
VSGAQAQVTGTLILEDYPSNQVCYKAIVIAGVASIDVAFSAFDTEAAFDILIIYDGTSATHASSSSKFSQDGMQRYSGSSLPEDIKSSGPSLLFMFTSDGSAQRAGFTAAWTSTSSITSLALGGIVWADVSGNLEAVKTSLSTDISTMLGVAVSAIINLELKQSFLLSGVICTFNIAAGASTTQTPAQLSQTLKETLANGNGQFTDTAQTTGKTVSGVVTSTPSTPIPSPSTPSSPNPSATPTLSPTPSSTTPTPSPTASGQDVSEEEESAPILGYTIIILVALTIGACVACCCYHEHMKQFKTANDGSVLQQQQRNDVEMHNIVEVPLAQPMSVFMVEVPPNTKEGQTFVIQTPSGMQVQVTVPAGMEPGMQFQVQAPLQ